MKTRILPAFIVFLTFSFSLCGQAQTKKDNNLDDGIPNPFDKKVMWGISPSFLFSSISGDFLPETYFTKPSLGIGLRVEYYPLTFLGLGLGLGYQQRGAGIQNPDYNNSPGNTDSTYLERLRFNTLEIPFSVTLRTPRDIFKGFRLSTSAGVIPMFNLSSNQVYQDPDNGNHFTDDKSSEYFKNDVAWSVSAGPEINTGGTGILQIHFIYTRGTQSIYNNSAYSGFNYTMGLRVSMLF